MREKEIILRKTDHQIIIENLPMIEMIEIVAGQMIDTLRKGKEDVQEAALITLEVQDHFLDPDQGLESVQRYVDALEADLIVLEGNLIF